MATLKINKDMILIKSFNWRFRRQLHTWYSVLARRQYLNRFPALETMHRAELRKILYYEKGRKWKGKKLNVDGLSLLSEDSHWDHWDSRRTVKITKLDQDRLTNDNGSRSCWYLTGPVFQVVRQRGRSFECLGTSALQTAERGNRWKLHPFGRFANSPPHLRVMMMVMIMIMTMTTATMMMMALMKLVVIIMALKIAPFSLTCKPKPNHFKTTFQSWCVQQTIYG